MSANHKNPQDLLNRSMPIADDIKLGDMLQEMISAHNSLLAKLDADIGINDTNYASTISVKDINARG